MTNTEHFVKVWQTSQSIEEVAQRFHSTKAQASLKAIQLRKRGVPLKRFRALTSDLPQLIALAKSLAGEPVDSKEEAERRLRLYLDPTRDETLPEKFEWK